MHRIQWGRLLFDFQWSEIESVNLTTKNKIKNNCHLHFNFNLQTEISIIIYSVASAEFQAPLTTLWTLVLVCCAVLCCCLKLATKSVSKLIETHIYCVEEIETRASCDKDRQHVLHSNRLKKNEFRWKWFWHEHRCTCWVSDGVKYKHKIATSVYIQIVHCLCIWVYVRRKRETTEEKK